MPSWSTVYETWNSVYEGSPSSDTSSGLGDDEFRELKQYISSRAARELRWGPFDGTGKDGMARKGSARAYYEASSPSKRPVEHEGKGSDDPLDTDDTGRLWIDSDDLTTYVWDGDSWEPIKAYTGGVVISDAQWSYLSNMDQGVATTDDVTFNSVTGTIAASNVTEISNLTTAEGSQLEKINTVSISTTQWGYLGALDQHLRTTDDVVHGTLTVDAGGLTIGTKTPSDAEWGHVKSLNQDLGTGDSPTFSAITAEGVKLTASEWSQLANIDSASITAAQWLIFGNMNQNVQTVSDVEFNTVQVDSSGPTWSKGTDGSMECDNVIGGTKGYRVTREKSQSSSQDENDIYDHLAPYLPEGVKVLATGTFGGVTICAVKKVGSVVTIYVGYDGTKTFTNGDNTLIGENLQIAF